MILQIEYLLSRKPKNITFIKRERAKWVSSNSGGDYIANLFQIRLLVKVIVHETTTTYLPNPNESTDRHHKTFVFLANTYTFKSKRKSAWLVRMGC